MDQLYMRRCLQLAANGRQNAKPNPMVGAVIVAADGRIIGEGYHVRCGEGHAEVNAFASVRPEDEALLPGATIYVSLEPCSHYGKTPPCADLIIKKLVNEHLRERRRYGTCLAVVVEERVCGLRPFQDDVRASLLVERDEAAIRCARSSRLTHGTRYAWRRHRSA